MSKVYKDGLEFSCVNCSNCCRYDPGYVFLSKKDLEQISEFLSLSLKEVKEQYCTSIGFSENFVLLSLIEKENNDCIFWNNGCIIYPVRPVQCQTYPFWSTILSDQQSLEREKSQCPGIGQGKWYSFEEIEQLLQLRKDNMPLIE